MDHKSEPDITAEERVLAERGAALISAAMVQTHAPFALREAIERDRARAAKAPASGLGFLGRIRSGAIAGVAVLAVGGVIGIISSGGGTAAPTIAQVAKLGGLPSLSAPPRASHGSLDAHVANVSFPSWKKLKWHAAGKRTDKVGGRSVTTVFYRGKNNALIGYSIVAGKALKGWPAGADVKGGDETYRLVRGAGHTTVIWNQDGRTCVVTAPSKLPQAKLMKLVSTESV